MASLAALVERMPGSIFLEFDFKTENFKLSDSSGSALGLESGNYDAELGFMIVHPEDRDRVRKFFENEMRTKPESELQHRLLINGNIKYYHSFFNTQFDKAGNPSKLYAFARDITKEVELQEQLERSYKLLERKNQNYREIVHDIKAPLANITAISQLIDLENKAKDAQELELIKALKASTEQVNQLIWDLNALEALRNEKDELGLQKYKLKTFLQEHQANLKALCERKLIELKIDIPENLWLLLNPKSFHRIFQNLVENAVKFSPKGSLIEIRAREKSNLLQITVKDEGIGIPKKMQPLLFKRQVKEKNRNGLEGELSTGLGLSIVSQIVQNHHGKIKVTSQDGKGSTFTLLFDLSPAPES